MGSLGYRLMAAVVSDAPMPDPAEFAHPDEGYFAFMHLAAAAALAIHRVAELEGRTEMEVLNELADKKRLCACP